MTDPFVLYLACWYPPHLGAGPIRTARQARYLRDAGFDVHVVAATPHAKLGARTHDAVTWVGSLDRLVPVRGLGVEVRRASSGRLRWLKPVAGLEDVLLAPDRSVAWVPGAIRAGDRLITARKAVGTRPVLILSTYGPAGPHMAARVLARRHHVPWVAEFRDPWAENPFKPHPTEMHARLDRRLERGVLESADAVVASTVPMLELLSRTGAVLRGEVVYNAFDPADLPPPEAHASPVADHLRVAHLGNVYDRPRFGAFLQALGRLADEGMRVELHQIGPDLTVDVPASVGLLRTGWLEHRAGLEACQSADLLVLTIPEELAAVSVNAKLFEYLALDRPVLALVPRGSVVERLMKQVGGGLACPDVDTDGVLACLRGALAGAPPIERERLAEFAIATQGARLAALLREVAAAH